MLGQVFAEGGHEFFVSLGVARVMENEQAAAFGGADEVGPDGGVAGLLADEVGEGAEGEEWAPEIIGDSLGGAKAHGLGTYAVHGGVDAEDEEDGNEEDGAVEVGGLAGEDAADFAGERGEFDALGIKAFPGAAAIHDNYGGLEFVVEVDDFPSAVEGGYVTHGGTIRVEGPVDYVSWRVGIM